MYKSSPICTSVLREISNSCEDALSSFLPYSIDSTIKEKLLDAKKTSQKGTLPVQ